MFIGLIEIKTHTKMISFHKKTHQQGVSGFFITE